jgi:lipopolysaccharide transport system permease protein
VNEDAGTVRVPPVAEREYEAVREAPLGPAIRVEPARGWRALDVKDVWRHRELLYFLTWRDVKVRYKQTAFGAGWAILQPLLTTLVFSVVFGRLAKIPSNGVPYPVFALAALVPWMFFSNAVTLGSNSITQTPDLITKIYFPRVLMPAASVLGGLLDVVIASSLLVAMTFYYGIVPGPEVLVLLPLLLLAVITALGVTLWLSALNVEYRDVRYALPFLVQLWLFATPVAYPSSLVDEPWRTILGLNPMAGVVEGFRWALLGTQPAPGPLVLASTATALFILVTGLVYFRRVEDRFADVI